MAIQLSTPPPAPRELVGDDPAIRTLRAAIKKVAKSDSTILIRGESGTGKELVAEALHRASERASGPLVSVNWHDDGQNFWDTHGDNFNHLKNRLMPPADQGLSALLDDLETRGLLDETLVVMTGEFGRTPRIGSSTGNNNAPDGRDHWAAVFSTVFAGAGVRGGRLVGASDRNGAYPASPPYTPGDLAATVRTNVPCAASLRKSCRPLDCMTELQPARVWPVVRRQLEAAARGCHAASAGVK